MDTEVTTTESAPEVTSTESTAPESTSSEGVELSSEEGKSAEPVKPAYVPDYKLKVFDEEKELDDPFLKSLIKDADSEKKVKEIAQKYLGYENIKEYKSKVEGEYKQYKEVAQPVMEYYNTADQMLRKDDLESFFKLVNIPDQKIFEYAVKKAEEMQRPFEERQAIQQQKQIQRERDYYQAQNQGLLTEQQRQLSEFRRQELNYVMARPEVDSIAKAWDAKNGPGSFLELVREKGLAHHLATNGKEDLSAAQAVEAVVKRISPFVTPTNPSATPANQVGQNSQGLIQQAGQPPIIPNVTGKGASPVRRQVRSVADIKKRSEELSNSAS